MLSCKTARQPVGAQPGQMQRIMVDERDRIESTAILVEATRQKILGNWPQAVVLYYEAIKKDPRNDAAHFELAKIHAMQGQFEDALKYAKQAAEIDPKNSYYLTVLADIYTLSNQAEQSIAIYQRLTREHPRRIDFFMSLANTYVYTNQFAQAYDTYHRVEEITGFSEEISLQKQKLLVEMGRIDEAMLEAEKLVRFFPDEPLFVELLSELYIETGQMEKARALFEKMLENDPDNPMAHLMMADYYQEKGETHKAFESLKKAFVSPLLDTQGKGRIMYSFYNLSDKNPEYLDQAIELCKLLIELQPDDAEPYLIYGDFLARDQQLEEARSQFLLGAQRDPSNLPVWQQILILDNQLGDYNSMLEHSNMALEFFFEQPPLFLFNGLANMQLKHYEDAASSLEYGAALVQNNPELSMQFYSMLGDTYHYLNDYAKSDQGYEKALKLDPKNATVLNNYAYHLAVRKVRLNEAETMAAEANRLSPGISAYQDTMGWVLFQLGRYNEAREWIGKAVQSAEEPSGTVLEHYGDVLFKLNQLDMALEYWKKAQQAGDASDLLQQKIKDHKFYE
jgi:tetratricopeptide (TPR) repeat protein